ncbi:MAG: type II toxin-antitoxin system VapC family toxin [Hyphomicrobiales bacterium]|nr:MAG: type II toxin-antitoxin system VapC family toxin [Hyphomicrobiales bacterium]
MILADTSVWIDHFRSPEPMLMQLAQTSELLLHPFVIGELAMGSLAERKLRLRLWAMMPSLPAAPLDDVLALVETRRLYSRGIGYADANLLASSLVAAGSLLWTRDRRLQDIARELGVLADLDG